MSLCPLCLAGDENESRHAPGCPNAFLEGMPEAPTVPQELMGKMEGDLGAHAVQLDAWAKMAHNFYQSLLRQFNNAAVAKALLLEWERIWFIQLYDRSQEGGVDDGPAPKDG